MSRKAIVALTISLGLLVAVATACESNSPQAHNTGTATASPSPSPTPPQAPQVGDKVTVEHGGMKYDVTLVSVAQPARPVSEYTTVPAGHHLAAAQFRVTATTNVDENSNTNAAAIGANDQVYTPAFDEVAEGTNFANGDIRLQPGASLVGWVAFTVPDGVRVARVRWTPGAGMGTKSAEWTVNTTSSPSPGASPPARSPAPGTAAPTAPASGPSDTVIAYFDAINLRDYRKAWELGGKNTTSSYDSFVSGFSTTSWVGVEILDLSGDTGSAVVTARLTTLETDGTSKVFQGEYTVRDGVITEFKVHQVS